MHVATQAAEKGIVLIRKPHVPGITRRRRSQRGVAVRSRTQILLLLGLIVVAVLIGVGLLLARDDERPFRFTIDPSLADAQPPIPGINDGPDRPVGVLQGPSDDLFLTFVENELMIGPESSEQLNRFLNKLTPNSLTTVPPLRHCWPAV
jgi:hypothetical protein